MATVLTYEHFEKTRLWTQKHDLSHIPEKDRQKARYKLDADYRVALLGEPMKLDEHIVRHDRPFTEVVSADYILVTPYTAATASSTRPRGGSRTRTTCSSTSWSRSSALKGRSRSTDQESATGFYPHAGILSTSGTSAATRRRKRTATGCVLAHVLPALPRRRRAELAARLLDAAAVTAKYPVPTMQASECGRLPQNALDPVAGCFQDFYAFEGVYGRRKDGWYKDILAAGFEGEKLPPAERALQCWANARRKTRSPSP
ncbi:MAG: hypothetical protein U0736_17355 [Gemmataceae bacterium]